MTDITLQDQNARDQAVDIYSSCIVSAPAGSGKTGLLTTRVLKLLAKVEEPEEILCITFTRKAAAEMRERIFNALSAAKNLLNDIPPDRADGILETLDIDTYEKNRLKLAYAALLNSKQRDWDIFNAAYRLKISTIDGFCKSLSTRLPFLSQMGVESGIWDDPTQAYREAVDLWLDDKLQTSDPIIDLIHSHFGGNVEQLILMLVKLLSVREQWLPFALLTRSELNADKNKDFARQYFESYIAELIDEAIDEAMVLLHPYELEICDLMSFAAGNLVSQNSDHPISQYYLSNRLLDDNVSQKHKISGFSDISSGDTQVFFPLIVDFLLTKTNTFKKRITKNDGFPTGITKEEKSEFDHKKNHLKRIISEISEIPGAAEIIAKLKTLPPPKYQNDQWKTLSLIVNALPDLVAYLRIVFSKKNKTDFTEYTLAAARALEDEGNIDLQQKLDYQIKHILIDEFQDTSQPQLNLLQSLIKEWLPDEGKTVFIVGDGMQSCYGFRNANVGIFLGIKQFGLSNILPKPLELNVNFRSTKSIVAWVNKVFSKAFPTEDSVSKGAVHYSSSFANNNADDHSIVSCKYFFDDDPNEASLLEAQTIAHTILNTRTIEPDQTIAILAKNRATFIPIISALQKYDIPFEAVDIDSLSSKKPIQDIHCLTRVCFDISDRIAWISLLRSPFVGLNFSDLYYVCTGDDRKTDTNGNSTAPQNTKNIWQLIQNNDSISELSTDGKIAINRLVEAFQQYNNNRFRSPLHKQIESLWLLLGGPQTLSSKSDLNNIHTYLNTLKSLERAGSIDNWQEFEQSLSKLYARPEIFPTTDNPVQIMTMHKSKGLEFDRVFLPGLQKSGRSDEKALLYWLEKTNHQQEQKFLLSPLSSIDEESNPLSDFIAQEKKLKDELEEVRLFYVACTRAKQHLHLSAVLKETDKGDVKAPAKNSLLAKIWDQVSDQFVCSVEGSVNKRFSAENHIITPSQITENAPEKNKPYIVRLPLSWKNFTITHRLDNTTHEIDSPQKNVVADEHRQQRLTFDNSEMDVFSEFADANKVEREVGTLLHRILHRIVQDSAFPLNEKRVQQSVPYWLNQLLQSGLSKADATLGANTLKSIIGGLLIDPKAQWILDPTHIESESELALSWKGRQWIIDRTFVVENAEENAAEQIKDQAPENQMAATRWIIDYKSAAPNHLSAPSAKDPSSSLFDDSAFFELQKNQYQQQLINYRDVLKAYDEHRGKSYTYRLALYFPALKAFCEYDRAV